MRLYTTDHGYTTATRRSWGTRRTKASETIKMLDGEGGQTRRSTYADLYKENPWVHASILRLARDVAMLDWQVHELDEDGHGERVRGDLPRSSGRPSAAERLDNMIQSPGDRRSKFRLILQTVMDRGIYGNALWVPDWADNSLVHVPWDNITVELDSDDMSIVAYEVDETMAVSLFGEASTTYLPHDVVHFGQGTDPEETLGMSPLTPLANSTRLMDAIHRYLKAYFANQANPSGNLKLPPGTDKTALQFVERQVQNSKTGPERAGDVMVTTGDWQSIRSEPSHSRAIKLDQLSREEVVSVLGVPESRLMGQTDPDDRLAYYRDVVAPWVHEIEDEITAQMLPMRPSLKRGIEVKADLDTPVRGDLQTRMQAYRQGRFIFTLNDFRRKEGLPPIDDPRADTVYLPANETPLMDGIGPGAEKPEEDAASGPNAGEINPDAEPNEFGDGVAAEDQRPTGNEEDVRALAKRLARLDARKFADYVREHADDEVLMDALTLLHGTGSHDESDHGNWSTGPSGTADVDDEFLPDDDGNPAPAIRDLVADATEPDSGFSIDVTTGEWPSDGYMVGGEGPEEAIDPDASVSAEAKATQDYVVDHADLLSREDVFLGGWRRPRDLSLVVDASVRIDSLAEAQRLAAKRGEDSIFDVVNLEVIDTDPGALPDAA